MMSLSNGVVQINLRQVIQDVADPLRGPPPRFPRPPMPEGAVTREQ